MRKCNFSCLEALSSLRKAALSSVAAACGPALALSMAFLNLPHGGARGLSFWPLQASCPKLYRWPSVVAEHLKCGQSLEMGCQYRICAGFQKLSTQKVYISFFLCWFLLSSLSVVSDSLQPHRLQPARLPCPSLSPGVCSNTCPLCR